MLTLKTATTRSVAKLQARDIERAVNRSGSLAARLWKVARVAAETRRVDGKIRPFDSELIAACTDELTDLMAFSYLTRVKLTKRRRSIAKSIQLASPVHDQAKQIADNFNIDLGNVRARFESVAGGAIKKSVAEIRTVMNRALVDATQKQLPTKSATNFVLKAVRKHGVQPRSTQYVETLVRTHSAISYGAAHRLSFEGDVDLWGWEYVTVGDDRVRPEHEELEGIRRKQDDPFWVEFWPPNGWNCRCQAVAIYDDSTKQTKVPKGVAPDEGFAGDFTDLI